MPLFRSSLSALRIKARQAFAARLPGADTSLRFAAVRIAADAMAGLVYEETGYLDGISKQFLAATAEGVYLDRIGAEAPGGVPRKGASPAGGPVLFYGLPDLPIPAGTLLQKADRSATYATQSAATLSDGGVVQVAVLATAGGSAGNADPAAQLQLTVAIAGVQPMAVVDASGLSGGLDREGDDAYRQRIIARKQQPPMGGAAYDYVAWAEQVPQCTRAWSYPLNSGAGTCDVTFVCDGRVSIIPLADDVAAVQASINAQRPVAAHCVVFTPVQDDAPVSVANLAIASGQVLASVQATIAANVLALNKSTIPGGTTYREAVSAAIANSAGVVSFDLLAPSVDIVSPFGHILQLAAPTFA